MKLKVQHVYDATIVLTQIINRQAAMPQRGKYLIGRMHAKLKAEFDLIDARRDEMIKECGIPQTGFVGDTETVIEGKWVVPADKMPDFNASWKMVGDEEIEVDIQPISLSALSLGDDKDGSIHTHELMALGDLITE